jgi:hypothetical protein
MAVADISGSSAVFTTIKAMVIITSMVEVLTIRYNALAKRRPGMNGGYINHIISCHKNCVRNSPGNIGY